MRFIIRYLSVSYWPADDSHRRKKNHFFCHIKLMRGKHNTTVCCMLAYYYWCLCGVRLCTVYTIDIKCIAGTMMVLSTFQCFKFPTVSANIYVPSCFQMEKSTQMPDIKHKFFWTITTIDCQRRKLQICSYNNVWTLDNLWNVSE